MRSARKAIKLKNPSVLRTAPLEERGAGKAPQTKRFKRFTKAT